MAPHTVHCQGRLGQWEAAQQRCEVQVVPASCMMHEAARAAYAISNCAAACWDSTSALQGPKTYHTQRKYDLTKEKGADRHCVKQQATGSAKTCSQHERLEGTKL